MMSIPPSIQPIADQAQASAKLWLDTTRENLLAGFDLTEKALSVRSLDDARELSQSSFAVARDSLERVVGATQKTVADTSKLAKSQAELAREQAQTFAQGLPLPGFDSLFDPKTYGLDTKAKRR